MAYALEYGTDEMEMHVDAINKGDRVVLVDDLIATGGTAEGAVKLLAPAGRRSARGVLHHRPAGAGRRRQAARAGRAGAHAGVLRGALASTRARRKFRVSRAHRSTSVAKWCDAEPGPPVLLLASQQPGSRICGAPFHAAPRAGHAVRDLIHPDSNFRQPRSFSRRDCARGVSIFSRPRKARGRSAGKRRACEALERLAEPPGTCARGAALRCDPECAPPGAPLAALTKAFRRSPGFGPRLRAANLSVRGRQRALAHGP